MVVIYLYTRGLGGDPGELMGEWLDEPLLVRVEFIIIVRREDFDRQSAKTFLQLQCLDLYRWALVMIHYFAGGHGKGAVAVGIGDNPRVLMLVEVIHLGTVVVLLTIPLQYCSQLNV